MHAWCCLCGQLLRHWSGATGLEPDRGPTLRFCFFSQGCAGMQEASAVPLPGQVKLCWKWKLGPLQLSQQITSETIDSSGLSPRSPGGQKNESKESAEPGHGVAPQAASSFPFSFGDSPSIPGQRPTASLPGAAGISQGCVGLRRDLMALCHLEWPPFKVFLMSLVLWRYFQALGSDTDVSLGNYRIPHATSVLLVLWCWRHKPH